LGQKIFTVRRLLTASVSNREKQKAWEMWLALYPHMLIPPPLVEKPALKFIPFSRFYKEQINPSSKSELTPEQIIARAEEIKKRHQKLL